MASIVVPAFMGQFPRQASRLRAESTANFALDVRARSGYLEARPLDLEVAVSDDLLWSDYSGTPSNVGAKSIQHIRSDAHGDLYLAFWNEHVRVVPGPLVNDIYERYYWHAYGFPRFNTAARIANGDPSYLIGNPRRTGAPTLAIQAAGSSTINEDRFYVFTLVDEYGHESAPSDPRKITCKLDATIRVTITSFTQRASYPDVEFLRIYRTVAGVNTADYFQVTDVPFGTWTYDDSAQNDAIAISSVLESAGWAPPPPPGDPLEMNGHFVGTPTGFLVGFSGRNLLFSEPYRPHAWPIKYTLSTDDPIVGLGVFGSNIAVLTTGNPYIASGTNPAAITLTRLNSSAPCLSVGSIVELDNAVLYSSTDGLVSVSENGVSIITEPVLTKEQWQASYSPSSIWGAREGESTYLGFFSTSQGFELDLADPARGIVRTQAENGPYTSVNSDPLGSRALVSSGPTAVPARSVYAYAADPVNVAEYDWRSKEFFFVKPINMGAAHIAGAAGSPNAETPETVGFELFADGVSVFSETVALNRTFRLPSGYKAEVFRFVLTGSATVMRVMIAETARELGFV